MPDLNPIFDKLSRSQSAFLHSADRIPTDLWQAKPSPSIWCPAEIVAHLCAVERRIVASADRIIRHEPRPVPVWKRFRAPMLMVSGRFIRRRAPQQVEPGELSTKEPMIADLRAVRERTLAFLQETSHRDLSAYYWPHPFLGMFGFYTWFEMIAAHQHRHTKQMDEIATLIPKHVVSSRK